MRGLSIRQPWAWAILHAGKRVENRTWMPPRAMVGQLFAIHAAKAFDKEAELPASVVAPPTYDLGAIVGVARLTVALTPRLIAERWPEQRRWAHGPYCFRLDEVRVLERPVWCRGMLGFWELPPLAEREVLEQLEPKPCAECGGQGWHDAHFDPTQEREQRQCDACGGSGEVGHG